MTAPSGGAAGSSRYRIEHVSRFLYSEPVRRCTMSLCLQPLQAPGQRLVSFSVTTTPPARLTTETDPFGNTRHVLTLHRDHDMLEVVSTSEVEMETRPDLPERLGLSTWDEVRTMSADPMWWDFTGSSPVARPSPALSDFVTGLGVEPQDDPLADLIALSEALNDAFEYLPGATSVDSTIDEFLASGKGVCQDYTHVMVAIARSWGVPTRYVSGYLYVTDPGSGQPGSAFGAATHAWAETRLPRLGWIGLDPTNRALADQRYVRIAVGRDYRDVPPTRGVIEGGGNSKLEVNVRMTIL
ncbi:MAG: transglutaminase family protein [bacterium]|nr:transglutaminase family protein [bacterium]MDE0602003.1 transglutaminase family protein [bacterium]